MIVAVSTTDGGLEDSVCPVFGRCPTFTIVDTDGMGSAKTIPNPGAQAGGGAGIAAAQAVIDAGAEAVITGNCGPNASGALSRSGIRVYSASGSLKAAVDDLLAGKLSSSGSPSVPGHFGMGRGFRGGRP